VVVIAPGRRTVHNAALTQVETPETPPPAPEVAPKKGGSKLKYIVPAALVTGGGGYLLYSQLTKNSPPVAAGSITPTGTGIAGLTPFTFDGSRSTDPDKDTLTYSWNFGDGQQGTGGSAQHVYATAGSFVVSLAVSDGKATSTASVGTVTVAPSVAGVWDAKLAYLGNLLVYRLTQNGATVGGTLDIMDYYTPTKVLFSAPVSGSLSGTRGYVLPCPITLSASISDFNFTGNYETDRTIVGTSDRYGAGTLTRR
jgi:PKD repeat protein